MWLCWLVGLALGADGLHVDAVATTTVPLLVGVGGRLETPQRLRVELDLGVFPSAYLDAVNSVAVGAGWYGEPTAVLLDVAISGALVAHPRVGWRPLEDYGFAFHGGYLLAGAGGGDLSGAEAAAVLDERDSDQRDAGLDATAQYPARAVIHILTVDVGWELVAWERLALGARLGGAFTVASSSTVDVSGPPIAGAVGEVLASLLDDTIQQYVHTPTLGIDVGYRFR